MTISDYIAIISIGVSVIISVVGGVYAVANNTKKFELAEIYKKEILEWYSHTIHILTLIIDNIENDNKDLLANLSAKIEIGRFYFPNVNKGDFFGKDKPSAYQGYRNIILDFLVYFYDTAKREDARKHKKALTEFMRLYFGV